MLLGEFQHSVDPKGRIFIPSRWRESFSEGVVVTKGMEHCLVIYPKQRFEELGEKMASLPQTQKVNRDFARIFYSGSAEEIVDRQGRVILPQNLRAFAELGREVVLVGVHDRAEVWAAEKWISYRQAKEGTLEEIAEQLDL